MKHILIILLSALAFASAQNLLPPDVAQKIDAYVANCMAAGKVPGLSLVIVNEGKVVYAKGYGFANLEQKTPMTERTLVPIGSTGKGMTALAVMQLVEQGKLKLDDPVVKYLPWFKVDDPRSDQITLRHLLSHTSGLPAGGLFDGKLEASALEARVRWLAGVKLHRAPGSGYEYANDGYATAGLVVQTVSGMPYQNYMVQKVFAPLGMNDSTFDPAKARTFQGYTLQRGVVTAVPTLFSSAIAPAGTMLSSAVDVGHYFEALLNGKSTLSQQALEEMWKPATVADAERQVSYALGWAIINLPSGPMLTHEGSIFTAGSFFALDPARKFGMAVLINLQNGSTLGEVGQGVFMLLAGQEVPPIPAHSTPAPSTFKPNPSVWQKYVGDYETGREPFRVYVEDGKLMFAIPLPTYPIRGELVPYSDSEFLMINLASSTTFDQVPMSFKVEADGSVTALMAGQPSGVKK